MAKSGRTSGKTPSAPPPGAGQRLVNAALALAARQGWRRTGLAEIAEEAQVPLDEAYRWYRSKPAIIAAWMRDINAQVLKGVGEASGDAPARERLFDTLMRRFDVLRPHRPALRAILRDSIGDPAALCRMAGFLRSIAWMLEASGISAAGIAGRVRVHLVAGLYLSVLRIFLQDESEDLSRTMAALDRGLKRGEQICGFARRSPAAQEAPRGAA